MATAIPFQSFAPDLTSCKLLPERRQPVLPTPYNRWTLANTGDWASFHRADGGFVVRFPGLADFFIDADGRSAACRPCPGLPAATREHLFLNQVWPLMLSRQGKLVFHASAVEDGPGALAFLAASGRGKSTLAAAFAVGGAPYLSDDGLAITRRRGVHMAHPGHPSIRLWDDSRAALLDGEVTTAEGVSYTSKARILSAAGLAYDGEPRPLAAAFFLGEGAATEIELRRLSGAEAVAAWVSHAFILDTEDAAGLDEHFRDVALLAERVPSHRLDYPRRYDALGPVRAAILEATCRPEADS